MRNLREKGKIYIWMFTIFGDNFLYSEFNKIKIDDFAINLVLSLSEQIMILNGSKKPTKKINIKKI